MLLSFFPLLNFYQNHKSFCGNPSNFFKIIFMNIALTLAMIVDKRQKNIRRILSRTMEMRDLHITAIKISLTVCECMSENFSHLQIGKKRKEFLHYLESRKKDIMKCFLFLLNWLIDLRERGLISNLINLSIRFNLVSFFLCC